jgi:hypothetical protein
MPTPIPLRPDYSAARSRVDKTLTRAATALLLAKVRSKSLKEILTVWPASERDAITRAILPPTATTTPEAQQLLGMVASDAVTVFAPTSAAAAVLSAGLTFKFAGANMVVIPHFTANATSVDFLGEGSALPVLQIDTSNKTVLKPYKIACISAFTREIFEHSIPSLETIIRAVIGENLSLALDSKILDTNSSTATRPAGLRAGIAASSASAAASPLEAMAEDIGTLIGSVAAVANNSEILLICSAAQAAALRLWNRVNVPYTVIASGGLSAGVVIAVASNALCSAGDVAPRFELSSEATLVFDSAPSTSNIDTAAVAATTKSLFQTDSIGLKLLFETSWALRTASGLSWLTASNW